MQQSHGRGGSSRDAWMLGQAVEHPLLRPAVERGAARMHRVTMADGRSTKVGYDILAGLAPSGSDQQQDIRHLHRETRR
eukprot:4935403-Amphidinium_carterae.2